MPGEDFKNAVAKMVLNSKCFNYGFPPYIQIISKEMKELLSGEENKANLEYYEQLLTDATKLNR